MSEKEITKVKEITSGSLTMKAEFGELEVFYDPLFGSELKDCCLMGKDMNVIELGIVHSCGLGSKKITFAKKLKDYPGGMKVFIRLVNGVFISLPIIDEVL